MRWTFGRKRATALVVVAVSVAAWAGLGGGTGAGAYARWSQGPCSVTLGSAHFWEDAPGAGVNEESALLYVANVANADETCSWQTHVPPITTGFSVEIEAAVNDGARLTIGVYNTADALMATTPALVADSSFQVVSAPLPVGGVGSVRMTLTDQAGLFLPNAPVASGRSLALLNYIRILAVDGTTLWEETFSLGG